SLRCVRFLVAREVARATARRGRLHRPRRRGGDGVSEFADLDPELDPADTLLGGGGIPLPPLAPRPPVRIRQPNGYLAVDDCAVLRRVGGEPLPPRGQVGGEPVKGLLAKGRPLGGRRSVDSSPGRGQAGETGRVVANASVQVGEPARVRAGTLP